MESANILTVILYITFAAIFFLLHQTFFIKSFPAKANTSCTCTCKPPHCPSVRLFLHDSEIKQCRPTGFGKSAGIKCCTVNTPKRIFFEYMCSLHVAKQRIFSYNTRSKINVPEDDYEITQHKSPDDLRAVSCHYAYHGICTRAWVYPDKRCGDRHHSGSRYHCVLLSWV